MMSKHLYSFLLFCVISLAIRGLYIFLFPHCFSYDLNSWDLVGNILMEGGNPYNTTVFLNWPPLWMQLIFLFKKISLSWHLPFYDVVRTFLIAVETLLALVLYAALLRFAKSTSATKLLIFGIALNPISILQVCQHCNFDVLVGFWILLAVYMLLRFQEQHEPAFWLGACFALGMGTATKTIPICLAPLLLLSMRKLKTIERWLGAAFLLLPVTLTLSVIYVLGPHDIETKVLGYRSLSGTFGFTGLFAYFHLTRLLTSWPGIFEIIYGIGWVFIGTWLWSKDRLNPQKLVSVASVLLVAIPALGPGYGMQYIYWFLPLLVLMYGLSGRNVRIFLLVFYGVAAAVYAIAYGFNFKTYGAFALEIIQTKPMLDFGLRITTPSGETFLCLPLWLLYMTFVGVFGAGIGREIMRDFISRRERH